MNSLSCILLLVERGEGVHRGLSKAVLLARHFGARLELLLCDTRRAVATPGEDMSAEERASAAEYARAACIAEGERYLRALRQTIVSAGVDIGAEVICAPSLAGGLAQKLRHTPVQIIVKAARPGPRLAGPSEWQLLERCAAPLLLTAGRPWRATPRFAAALDLSERADRDVGGHIVGLCEALAHRCGAELDYLYAAPVRDRTAQLAGAAHRRLCSLLPAGDRGLGRLQYCSGEPAGVLPRLITHRDYDLLALGAAPGASGGDCDRHGDHGKEADRADLAAALLKASAGDVLLLPAGLPAAKAAGLRCAD